MSKKSQLESIIEMNSRIGNLINQKNDSLKKENSIKQKLHEIVYIISNTIHAERIGIFLLNRENKIVPASTLKYSKAIKKLEYNLGQGLIGKSIEVGDTIYIPNLKDNKNSEFIPSYQSIGEYSKMNSVLIIPLRVGNKNLGAIELVSEEKNAFSEEYIKSLRTARDIISLGLESLEYNKKIILDKMKSMYSVLEMKHKFMKGHSERVKNYVSYLIKDKELYAKLGLNVNFKELIIESAQLHDIGKIQIDDKYLSAKTRFIQRDNPIRQHARIGYDLLINNNITENTILNIVRYHHEDWNGKGYPDNLSNIQIPVESRLVAIADSFDAICSERPYKKSLPLNESIKELENSSEKRFDPNLLENCIPILKATYPEVSKIV